MDEEQKQPPFVLGEIAAELESEEIASAITPEMPEETKGEKFKRLAQLRVNNILNEIELLDVLATNEYEYTPEQIQKMFNALENELLISKKKFSKHKMVRFTF